jgi:hypothetical protein
MRCIFIEIFIFSYLCSFSALYIYICALIQYTIADQVSLFIRVHLISDQIKYMDSPDGHSVMIEYKYCDLTVQASLILSMLLYHDRRYMGQVRWVRVVLYGSSTLGTSGTVWGISDYHLLSRGLDYRFQTLVSVLVLIV